MRSIVIAFRLYTEEDMEPRVSWMFNHMKDRMGNKLTSVDYKKISQYVLDCISLSTDPNFPMDVEMLSDELGAIPPIFLLFSFAAKKKEQHLQHLLKSFSLFDGGPGKQLEIVAKNYDLFRADLELPAVPGHARVIVPNEKGKPNQWYKELGFPKSGMEVRKEAFLKQVETTIVTTNITLEFGQYYFPSAPNHPWVDRAYVTRNPNDKELCLVLAQDKVNSSDFAKACNHLNSAASLLTAKSKELKQVLLIVNVIGATDQTRAQSILEWPYVLIRGQNEVRSFYTAHFADMVWFARERHLLSLESSS